MKKTYFKKTRVSSISMSFNDKFLGDNARDVYSGSCRTTANTVKHSIYDYSLGLNIKSAEYFDCNIVEHNW